MKSSVMMGNRDGDSDLASPCVFCDFIICGKELHYAVSAIRAKDITLGGFVCGARNKELFCFSLDYVQITKVVGEIACLHTTEMD